MPGKAVNVNVVSGQVLLKVPGGKFVPLTNATQIPVGSQLDTRKGRVKLTSAATKAGKTQTSDFYDGIFQVKQAVPKAEALTTDLVMKGQSRRMRAVRAPRRQQEEGAEVGARQAVGQRQGQVPHERQVQLGDRPRDDLAGRRTSATGR